MQPKPLFPTLSAISLIIIGALNPLYAAESSTAEKQQPQQGGDFVWGIETNPTTLNPQFNGQTKVELVQRAAFESLLARKPDGSYIPWLATGYEISPDHKTYTFRLRHDVTFSNGEKFNAEAVAENFRNLKNLTYCAGSTMCVIGSRIASITTPDEFTVAVTLNEVYSPFLSYASWLKMISPSSYKAADLKSGGTDIAGTGPFILKRWDKNQQIVFTKNPNYHWASANAAHQGSAYLNSITYRILPESSVRTGALLSGQVDAIEGISGNDAGEFVDNPDFSYQSAPNTGTPYSLFLNIHDGPTKERNVRLALLQGLDVTGIVKSIYRGHRIRAWGVTSPIDPLYDKSIEGKYGDNPQLANKLLDEAGWSTKGADGIRTKDGNRLSILIVQSQVTVRDQRDVLLEALQAQARQRLGIELKIRYVDPGTYFQYIKNGNYGSIANSHDDTDGLDLENHYLPRDKGGAINYSRTEAPEVTAWLNEAAHTLDEPQRKAIYSKLQDYAILQQALALPLYAPDDEIAAASYVHGIGFRAFRQIPENAYDVWVSKH